jgi:homospermidine synthase
MNLAAQANAAMIAAADAADKTFDKLTRARGRGAKPLVIAGLEAAYAQRNERVNQLWDAWNDAMLSERLARI